jgi:plasmid stability protein
MPNVAKNARSFHITMPEELYWKLKVRAAQEHRNMNAEIVELLEQDVK